MQQKNPMLCNPETGVCEITPNLTHDSNQKSNILSSQKPIKLIYYTDPICSSCWGIEPQLRKLKLEYGDCLEIDYRMGGLLPDWSYNSGGISKPSDVAHHWDEVSLYYDMPIDGDVWLENPLASSYPPSIACKAAQIQDEHKAVLFLRIIREMVFLQKKDITQWTYLLQAANSVGLDTAQFKMDYEGAAKELFHEDLKLGKELGVRGFPTIYFTDNKSNTLMVYGSKPYSEFENTLLKLYPTARKNNYSKDALSIFSQYNSLTAREFSVLTNTPRKDSEQILNELSTQGLLDVFKTKNGSLWRLKTTSHK